MATIKDVARLAGVSPSTASRALHNSSLISAATKEKIWAAMKELDYSPNFAAQNLANREANIVGVIFPPREISVGNDPFFVQVIQGIEAFCSARSYLVSVATAPTVDELIHNIEIMIKQGSITKFIFAYSKADDPVRDYVSAQPGVRYVVIGTPPQGHDHVMYVNNDNITAGSDATAFLMRKGYRHLAYVSTNLQEFVQNDRYLGYQRAMRAAGCEPVAVRLSNGADRSHDQTTFAHFLNRNLQVDAFVVCDDITGLHVQNMLKSLRRDTQEYGMIGFNNSVFAETATPTMTSVEIFPRFLGNEAAVLVMDSPEKEKQKLGLNSSMVVVPHKIVERNSSRG